MTSLTHDIKEKLQRLNVFEKIITVNIVVFFVGWFINATRNILKQDTLNWLELPVDFFDVIVKPWSIITYGFAHYDLFHLLMNMVVLYFISRSMVNLFPPKQSLSIYFMGILSGALLFLLVYNVIPNSFTANVGPLVGASAGVNALLIFLCAYMPNRETKFFAVSIKLWHIGLAIIIIDFIGLFGSNQGGKVAHFGGSILGCLYATQLLKGVNIGQGFEKILDRITNFFKVKSTLKTVHKNKNKSFAGHNKEQFNEFNNQKKIDLILDKISKSGYESLTNEEKTFLFKAGKD